MLCTSERPNHSLTELPIFIYLENQIGTCASQSSSAATVGRVGNWQVDHHTDPLSLLHLLFAQFWFSLRYRIIFVIINIIITQLLTERLAMTDLLWSNWPCFFLLAKNIPMNNVFLKINRNFALYCTDIQNIERRKIIKKQGPHGPQKLSSLKSLEIRNPTHRYQAFSLLQPS